jgi:hypothetical protein
MFEVREITATELFRAQQRKLQGRLRLDISSHCFPANPDEPFDLLCARVAIGERVVQMLQVCAVEAKLPASDRNGFHLNALPPPPDASDLLLVMPKRNEFEQFVLYRLNGILGLDAQSPFYQPAISNLAEDFYSWGQTDEAKGDFVVDTTREQLFVRCKRQPDLSRLEPTEEMQRQWVDN